MVILGGGFGGAYTALHLRRVFRPGEIEVTLVSRENFLLFTPMLHEVAASDVDVTHIVSPLRQLVRSGTVFNGEVEGIDLDARLVRVRHVAGGHPHGLPYDHLVIALGSTTNFFGVPGVADHAVTMKTLGDAIDLRSRTIALLEEAEFEAGAGHRGGQLAFVVAGGGFAGVETAGALNDFVREALPYYPHLHEADVRMVLVEPGPMILPELGPSLGRYAAGALARQGVEVKTGVGVTGYDGRRVRLSTGESVAARTLIWTAGTAPASLLRSLPVANERGRIAVAPTLAVPGHPGVWALGDAAVVPGPDGRPYPPTAQHAIRQARLLAENLARGERGRPLRPFVFKTLGLLAAIGRRRGVARILGINFSGFAAWLLWRTIYLAKLPRFDRKVRVALDWLLDLVFAKDLVQYHTARVGNRHQSMEPAVPEGVAARPD